MGKTATAINLAAESLSLATMPDEIRNLCRLADISSKSLLLQVIKQETPEKMTALIEKIGGQGAARRPLRDEGIDALEQILRELRKSK